MTHARITQARMFDWIRACIDTDSPLPTDADIVDQYGLPSIESARSLLADLSDAGKISIRGVGADRVITLGPKERARLEPSRPTRTVTHRSIAEEVADEALASSARRTHAKKLGALTPLDIAVPDSPPAHCARADAAKGRSLVDTPPVRVEAAPQPVAVEPPTVKMAELGARMAKQVQLIAESLAPLRAATKASTPPALKTKRLPTGRVLTDGPPKYRTHPKTVGASVTREMYARLGDMAKADGINRSQLVEKLITEALTARDAPPVPQGKPRVRADVVKAWQQDGRPFVEFIEYLLDAGLCQVEFLQRPLSHDMAEAAE